MQMYDIEKKINKKGQLYGISLVKVETRCLYLDEIIDIKYIKDPSKTEGAPKKAIMCSNNETLKLVDIETGKMELFGGHSDIILCVD